MNARLAAIENAEAAVIDLRDRCDAEEARRDRLVTAADRYKAHMKFAADVDAAAKLASTLGIPHEGPDPALILKNAMIVGGELLLLASQV